MRLIISFTALLLSVIFQQLSSGGLGPLDALSGLTLGFTSIQVGLLGSSHFLGFFIGCWFAPRLMGTIGHSRAYAAFAASGMVGLLLHMMVTDPMWWTFFRLLSGLCIAGCYTVIEAWLQAKITNETRGRAMGIYRGVDMGASLVAQLMISVLEPATYFSYNILALLCCASLLPLTLTRASPPETPSAPRLKPLEALRLSPLAIAAVITAGVTSSSFRMVGPIYGKGVGLEVDQLALFLAAFVLGGAVAQYPVGWIADKFNRRWVMVWLSAAAICSCVFTMFAGGASTEMAFLSAFVFGLSTFPLYSIAAAHANDFAKPEQVVELSAALIFFFAIGAIASPLVSSALIEWLGPPALFGFISIAHLLLLGFSLLRMEIGPKVTIRSRYRYIPRTSFIFGKLFKRD